MDSKCKRTLINITSGSNGMGNGTVFFTVAPNDAAAPRTGSMVVAGHPVTIIQDGDTCAYAAWSFYSTALIPGNNVYGSKDCAWTHKASTMDYHYPRPEWHRNGIVKYAMQQIPMQKDQLVYRSRSAFFLYTGDGYAPCP